MEDKQKKYAELKSIGYKKLKGPEREELKALEIELGIKQATIDENMQEHTVTEEDLANNPDLVTQGVKAGEVIMIPIEKVVTEAVAPTLDSANAIVVKPRPKLETDPTLEPGVVTPAAEGQGNYTMTRNVKWNGVNFSAGQEVSGTGEYAAEFLRQGYMK